MKYAADGKDVEVALSRAPGGVRLAVRDRGPGIPPEEQSRIFERFYRARSARDRNVRGSGIGLALVKHIVEAHGGRLAVASVLGEGATFTVTLPAAPPLVRPVVEPASRAGTGSAASTAESASDLALDLASASVAGGAGAAGAAGAAGTAPSMTLRSVKP